jgi:hypothetical protein
MFIAGITSFFGDKFWYWLGNADICRHHPTGASEQSSLSRLLPIASIAGGGACAFYAWARPILDS